MNKPKILHITALYPNDALPQEGIWVRNHIRLLDSDFENFVIHVNITRGRYKMEKSKTPDGLILKCKFPSYLRWRIIELLVARFLGKTLKEMGAGSGFSMVNFHLAYPLMVHLDSLLKFLPEKKLLIEHSSSYHFHFRSNQKLARIKRIFHQRGLKIVAVSESLANDIRSFSGFKGKIGILPNSVNTEIFYPSKEISTRNQFLMAAVWADPKKPLDVLHAIANARTEVKKHKLKIAGNGFLWNDIVAFVRTHQLQDIVELVGPLNNRELAREMNRSIALLMPTGYETFSVVVHEAMCCGLPVITNRVGALTSTVTEENGIFVGNEITWIEAMNHSLSFSDDQRKNIASEAQKKVSQESVGSLYRVIIAELLSDGVSEE